MNYYEVLFTTHPTEDYQQDLLIDELASIGFDTFEETDLGFNAYIPVNDFNEELLNNSLDKHHQQFEFTYSIQLIPQKNWNEVWESNFEPIQIKDKVWVRATFHPHKPDFDYEIVIDPKMSFGTGHHETTSMVMELMLDADLKEKKVLDMGCGTGILAILASKLGAKTVTAIDYDPVCYESTVENAALNAITNIIPLCGSKEVIPNEQFGIVLANINRNILLDQISTYAMVLKYGGEIYFSGFYENPDLDVIKHEAEANGLKYVMHRKVKDWVAAKFIK